VHQAENDRHEHERGDGREYQAADHRPSEWAFCSPPSPKPNAIGAMPDNHCQSRHEHGPEAHKTRLQCGCDGSPPMP